MVEKRISRRRFAAWVGCAAVLPPLAGHAQAAFPQPGRPIRIVVGLAAGGSLDSQARAVARRLTEVAGTQVIVDNKPGASMMLSASEVLRAQPDGYTLLYAPSSLFAQNPHTLSSVPYDPFKDFTPITLAARGPLVLTVHQSLPVQNAKDLVAWAEGPSGPAQFRLLRHRNVLAHLRHRVRQGGRHPGDPRPLQGHGRSRARPARGRVQAYFDAAPTAIQNAATGRIRMVGVASPKRMPAAPDVPTFTEQGIPGMDLTSWIAFVGPAKMPPELVTRLNALLVQSLDAPDVKDFYARGAWEAAPSSPAELSQEMRVAYDRWGQMIKQIGFEKQ
jgi:tripartite-type tricarboxylate transporter receptor subunit TctC